MPRSSESILSLGKRSLQFSEWFTKTGFAFRESSIFEAQRFPLCVFGDPVMSCWYQLCVSWFSVQCGGWCEGSTTEWVTAVNLTRAENTFHISIRRWTNGKILLPWTSSRFSWRWGSSGWGWSRLQISSASPTWLSLKGQNSSWEMLQCKWVLLAAPRELQQVGGRNRMERSFKFGACFSFSTCLYYGGFRYSALQSVTTQSAVFNLFPNKYLEINNFIYFLLCFPAQWLGWSCCISLPWHFRQHKFSDLPEV